jgi:hypothetical protein
MLDACATFGDAANCKASTAIVRAQAPRRRETPAPPHQGPSMTTPPIETQPATSAALSDLSGSNRRTLDAIFAHPLAHNLGWNDVVSLLDKIGQTEERENGGISITMAGQNHLVGENHAVGEDHPTGQHHLMLKRHTKDLTPLQLVALRRFMIEAGWAAGQPPETAPAEPPEKPLLMVVVDHHGARIFEIELRSGEAAAHTIRPYDPHHFLHHLVHKDQDRERGQRAPEDFGFYEKIADALAAADRIVLVGHGAGKSSAAAHLSAYLQTHRNAIHRHVIAELSVDLSSITDPQLLELAERTCGR